MIITTIIINITLIIINSYVIFYHVRLKNRLKKAKKIDELFMKNPDDYTVEMTIKNTNCQVLYNSFSERYFYRLLQYRTRLIDKKTGQCVIDTQ